MEGVLRAERVRVRRAGKHHFVDVTISVPRTASFEKVHDISDAVEKRVEEIFPPATDGTKNVDVMVHMEPRAQRGESLLDTIRALAQRRGLAIHEISAHAVDHQKVFVEMHMEVEEHLSLREAHRQSTQLEEDILFTVGDAVAGVNIHIEPLGGHIAEAGVMRELSAAVQAHINSLCAEYSELLDCHEVLVREADQRIIVSCHCAMDGNLPITKIHDVTEALQDRVKKKFPQIFEVNIHPEPVEES
jgi:divalent metal cation (Fe/Co/Zn/Cd) transporter